jgi:PPP family 3-phenylpropionic acid transporter
MNKAIPFAFYFVYFAGFASIAPFIILYFQELGFSGVQLSLITGVGPLVTLFFSPYWTQVADATRRHKLIMSAGLILSAATMVAFPFLKIYTLLFLAILFFNVVLSPLTSLADSATMTMLGNEKALYGRLRLGGTIGWGLAAPIAGALIQDFGLKMAFWSCAAMLLVGLVVSQGFQFEKTESGVKPQGGVRALLANREWIIFLALALVGGIAFASSASYYSPYMKELGANERLIGWAVLVSTLSEIPVFLFGNRLIRKFNSYGLLIFALVMTGLRSLLFAAATTPTLGLLVQLLQGLTFPAAWIAGVAYAEEHAPEGLKSAGQGLFGAMTFGFGSAVGGFMGGLLLERLGGRGLFFVYGVVVLAGVAVAAAARSRFARRPSVTRRG